MNTYTAGTTIRFEIRVKDNDGLLIDPDSAKITIYLNSAKAVDAENMTKVDTGEYYYNWQSSESNDEGVYGVQVDVKLGSYPSIKKSEREFYLRS